LLVVIAAIVLLPSPAADTKQGKSLAFTWNTVRELGAALVADDSLTDVEIAKQAGVHKATLERWKKAPEFQARVRDVRASLKSKALEIALQYGIADVRQRIRSLDERWKKMQRVIAERAKDPVMEKAAGGRTGLLVHRRRVIGQGDNSMMVDEYEVDTGLLRELREHSRQAAQEMGKWVSKHEDVTDYDGRYDDWTEEEIKEQLELNRKRTDRQRAGSRDGTGTVEMNPERTAHSST
jgi:hypothetical protein